MGGSARVKQPTCVLVTGATGFLGKVVVEELLRRRQALSVDHIVCLVRPKRGVAPAARFAQQTATSPCFSRLPDGWTRRVSVVAGELARPGCGLDAADALRLQAQVTHIIHCAASVDFDRPLKEACTSNIVSGLHMLEFAQKCKNLKAMVSTSTAYVAVHRLAPIEEALEPLPRPASVLYDDILRGDVDEAQLLAETGHANTYTYTKCIAEHLLCERRGTVPLAIVRPSIISASWQHPMPGWIDSKAAFAGFVATIGSGYLRLLDADNRTRLDLVPVDMVAERLIDQAMGEAHAKPLPGPADTVPAAVPIVYAVCGRDRGAVIQDTWRAIVRFYRRNPTGRRPGVHYVGGRSRRYRATEMLYHRVPTAIAVAYCRLRRDDRGRRRAKRLGTTLKHINHIFPYFTHHTFDFRPSVPLRHDFDALAYVDLVCQGVYRHLMRRDATQVPLGGSQLRTRHPDTLWGLTRTQGNVTTRATAILARKILRRSFDAITFDRQSFDVATRHAGSHAQYVVVPTHRSYLDFLVCAYLFLARPDLGIALPHMAAAPRLFDVPVLGTWMRRVRAFARAQAADATTSAARAPLQRLIQSGKNVQFFLEGERSRTRQFMAPQLEMLQALQETHRDLVILPVAISYDRVAEESPFLREMKGSARTSLSLASLAAWAQRMVGHKVHLGRVHLRCGAPQTLNVHTDVRTLGRNVMAELQRHTVASTFHLRCFVALHPEAGVDVAWLRRAIEQRGGTVIDSPLTAPSHDGDHAVLDPALERSMRHHWQHHFFADAQSLAPHNVALAHYIAVHQPGGSLTDAPPDGLADKRLRGLLQVLFAPVCADYAAVATAAHDLAGERAQTTAHLLLRQAVYTDYATAQLGVQALLAGRLLGAKASDGPQSAADLHATEVTQVPLQVVGGAALAQYATRCAWPDFAGPAAHAKD